MASSLAEILPLLACPACHGILCEVPGSVACRACQRIYPVRDGIPVLVVDEAVSSRGTVHRET